VTESSILPNLAEDFLRIHKVITRGLSMGIDRGSEFIKVGFPNHSLQQGFALYLQTLIAVVSAHHLGEDEVAFPALKRKLPAVPYASLAADHVKIEAALDSVKNSLPELGGDAPAAALAKAVEGLQRILKVWMPHIQIEQSAFSATAITGAMTQEEQSKLSLLFGQHAQEHVGPPFFALPFVLFNLSPDDRAKMTAVMPKMMVEELIPGVWKEKWAPMKPFLLE
jgi:hypothetical protein